MTDLLTTAFIQIRIWDVIDILLVGLMFYGLYYLVKGTTAIKIFSGIVAIIIGLKIVTALNMELLSFILGAFVNVGFIALIIIFQPEIRRFLLGIGKQQILTRFFGAAVFAVAETACESRLNGTGYHHRACIAIFFQSTKLHLFLT